MLSRRGAALALWVVLVAVSCSPRTDLELPPLASPPPSVFPTPPPPIPELELRGGLPPGALWRLQDGPDFYVYRAELPDASVLVYFGTWPQVKSAPLDADTAPFLGQPMHWWPLQRKSRTRTKARQGLMWWQRSPAYSEVAVHVIVDANSDAALQRVLVGLASTTAVDRAEHADNPTR